MIDVATADGILYTEYKFISEYEDMDLSQPDTFVPRFIRAAHLYNTSFRHVRDNFAIAGLIGCITVSINLIISFIDSDYQDLKEFTSMN